MTKGSWTQILGFVLTCCVTLDWDLFVFIICFEIVSYITQAGLKLTR